MTAEDRRLAGGGFCTLVHGEHDGVADIDRAAESPADLRLVLDLDAARGELPAWRGEIGLDLHAGRQGDGGAELLLGIEFLAHAPPVLAPPVDEPQIAFPRRGR